ncbi:hypothetical protein HHI36_024029 [Cryptolaemus montrouzieri]|uniref:Uncharacterized protein n=1 Tax=Cryptolaemus montrouzieri TaxID=559131 RepID=A0ABD2NCR2_9CUCU
MEAQSNRLTSSISHQEIVDIIRSNLLPDYVKVLVLHDISTIPDLTSLCKELKIFYKFIKIMDLLLAGNIINIIFLKYLNPKMYLQMFVVGNVKNLVLFIVITRFNIQFSIVAVVK